MGEAALWPIKQWSINQTIWAGTGMGLAALLSLGTVSLVNLHRFQQANDSVQHTQEVERAIQELLSSLQDAETGQRGYLLTGQSSYLQPYRTALGQIQLQVDALTELTADNPRQQARLAGLQPLIQSKLAELADTIARHDQQGYEAALLKVRTNQGKVAMDQIRRIIQEMEREELLLLVQHRAVKPQIVDQTLGITGLISLVGAASFIATAWLLNRNLARRRQVEAMQWASVEAATAAHCRVVQILESITDGFVALDQNWRYTYVNQQAGEMLNRAPAELVGKQIWEEFPEGVGQKFYQVYHRAMAEQKPVQLEEYYPPWNRWFENRIYPSAEGLTIFFQDTTIRKQAELALQQSEENFRQLAESVREVFFISILDKAQPFPQVLYVNPAFEQIWGQPCEQLYQDSQLWLNSIHPEDRESVQADLARQLQGEELCHQYRITKPDGETRWISTRTFFVEGNAGHPIRIVGVAEDITERKQTEIALQHAKEFLEQEVIKRTAELRQSNQQLQQELARRRQTEAALRESEARFRSAFDDAAIGMALVAPVGHWLRVNPALCNLIGYTEAELLKRSFRSVTHPEDLEIDRPYIHQLLTGDIQAYQIEKRYIHQQGHIISTLLSVSLVRDAANHPLYFVVQVQDISQRKQAEEELRQEKQFTERLIHSSVDGIAAFDLNYRHTLWNPGMERFFQINAEQALGKTHFGFFRISRGRH